MAHERWNENHVLNLYGRIFACGLYYFKNTIRLVHHSTICKVTVWKERFFFLFFNVLDISFVVHHVCNMLGYKSSARITYSLNLHPILTKELFLLSNYYFVEYVCGMYTYVIKYIVHGFIKKLQNSQIHIMFSNLWMQILTTSIQFRCPILVADTYEMTHYAFFFSSHLCLNLKSRLRFSSTGSIASFVSFNLK